jgi:hypothetical protein
MSKFLLNLIEILKFLEKSKFIWISKIKYHLNFLLGSGPIGPPPPPHVGPLRLIGRCVCTQPIRPELPWRIRQKPSFSHVTAM